MIALSSDFLLFRLANGESVPFSAEMVSVTVSGKEAKLFDEEFVDHATKAVFYYFKHELGLQSVSVADFAAAMETVLHGFVPKRCAPSEPKRGPEVVFSDLGRLAVDSGEGCDLFFFSRLREELRRQLQQGARVMRFHGLRGCVKRLVGAKRWSVRCQTVEEQIVEYLRECMGAEPGKKELALVVD